MRYCCCCQHIPSELTRFCFCLSLFRRPPSHLPSTMPPSSSLAYLPRAPTGLGLWRAKILARLGLRALRTEIPAGLGLLHAEVSAGLGLWRAEVRFWSALGSGAPRFQPASAWARQGSGRNLGTPGSGVPRFRPALGFGRGSSLRNAV